MTTSPPRRFRLSLVSAAIIPIAVAAVVAVTPVGSAATLPVLVAGVLGAVGVAVASLLLTRRLAALTEVATRVLAGESPEDVGARAAADELGTITLALLELETRRQAAHDDGVRAREAYRRSVGELTAGLNRLGDGLSVAAPTPGGPCADAVDAAGASLQEAAKKVGAVRQRLAQSTKILQEIPAAVVLLDNAGVVRYANAAAERVLGRPLSACVRKDFRTLVAQPTAEPEPLGRPVLDPQSLAGWFKQGATGEAVVELAHADGYAARVELIATRVSGAADGLWYVCARDLTREYGFVGADRTRTREESLRAVWESTARAGVEPVEAILAAARLLSSDAKQLAGRDTMLPRLATIRRHAGGLEAYVRTIRWLNLALWGELPQPLLSEFQAAEPVRAAVDQLSPRLKDRNVTVSVTDRGGWMCGDDEWVRTAVIGVLSHAGEATQGGTIGLRLERVAPADATSEERIAFEVIDAGPPLTPAQRADLEKPFGGLTSPSFLDPGAAGFLPGLVLAAELARRMGGTLEFDATPGGGLVVRMLVPARAPGSVVSEPAAEAGDVGPLEELVLGWRLGVA